MAALSEEIARMGLADQDNHNEIQLLKANVEAMGTMASIKARVPEALKDKTNVRLIVILLILIVLLIAAADLADIRDFIPLLSP